MERQRVVWIQLYPNGGNARAHDDEVLLIFAHAWQQNQTRGRVVSRILIRTAILTPTPDGPEDPHQGVSRLQRDGPLSRQRADKARRYLACCPQQSTAPSGRTTQTCEDAAAMSMYVPSFGGPVIKRLCTQHCMVPSVRTAHTVESSSANVNSGTSSSPPSPSLQHSIRPAGRRDVWKMRQCASGLTGCHPQRRRYIGASQTTRVW
jgi:hypothetical protein